MDIYLRTGLRIVVEGTHQRHADNGVVAVGVGRGGEVVPRSGGDVKDDLDSLLGSVLVAGNVLEYLDGDLDFRQVVAIGIVHLPRERGRIRYVHAVEGEVLPDEHVALDQDEVLHGGVGPGVIVLRHPCLVN